MDRKQVEKWLEAYGRAWEGRDPRAAAELFTEDATYQETPFVEPARGRDAIHKYWENVARTQQDIHFQFEVLALTDRGCFAQWHSTFLRLPQNIRLELDGIFLLSFSPQGRCTALREWWHRKEITNSSECA
jgi:SnoaL-like domain